MDVPIGQSNEVADDFVFATYFLALRDAWSGRISNDRLITTLYDIICDPQGLLNRKGEPIVCSPPDATRLKKRQADVHRVVKDNCKNKKLEETIVPDFEMLIMSNLENGKIDALVATLMRAIEASSCSAETVRELSDLSEIRPPTKFLARSFQESLLWNNRISNKKPSSSGEDAYTGFPKFKGKIDPDIPEDIADKEMPYVYALVRVYGEEENADLRTASDVDQYPRYKQHLQRQRKDYYSAEFVRRCMRDAYDLEGDDQFDILEQEIYDGVIDTHCRKFDTGKDRLDEVLSQATRLSVDGVWANRDTDWIRTGVKKGVCHFLVNDEKIKGWLDEDR